jgi:hypothetical protein
MSLHYFERKISCMASNILILVVVISITTALRLHEDPDSHLLSRDDLSHESVGGTPSQQLEISLQTHEQFADEPIHEFVALSPCPPHQTAYANNRPSKANGCGVGGAMNNVLTTIAHYISLFEPCCNVHDLCFQSCGAPNFQESFNNCNSAFKSCMFSQCRKHVKGLSWFKGSI